jgi:hypothetical protein
MRQRAGGTNIASGGVFFANSANAVRVLQDAFERVRTVATKSFTGYEDCHGLDPTAAE